MIKRVLVPLDEPDAALWSDSLRDVAARLPDGTVDHVVRFGDPASEILTEADAFGADTIVVTTSTRSSVKRAPGQCGRGHAAARAHRRTAVSAAAELVEHQV